MGEMSRASVLVGPERLEAQEFPVPKVGADDGLLKVEAAGICGSDWEQFRGRLKAVPETYPVIPGHEIVGRIEDVGPAAAARWNVEPGDRVVIGMTIAGRGVYGLTNTTTSAPSLWGGYADYMYLHPGADVYKVPDGVSAEVAALYVPLSNGVKWTTQIPHLAMGDVVVVQGPGQQGLGCAIAAMEAGASKVIVTGTSSDHGRLALARLLGVHVTIDVEAEDPVDAIREATGGRMADLVLDISAEATAPVALSLDMVRNGGQVVLAGLKSEAAVSGFISDKIVLKGITIRGSSAPTTGDPHRHLRVALDLMASGRYPLERLCTHSFSLDDAEKAVRTVGRQFPDEDPVHVTICPTL
jgi:2-desacetyl-2-hydroxyethyl bacteriochlorophyllide A dehydrogenase